MNEVLLQTAGDDFVRSLFGPAQVAVEGPRYVLALGAGAVLMVVKMNEQGSLGVPAPLLAAAIFLRKNL